MGSGDAFEAELRPSEPSSDDESVMESESEELIDGEMVVIKENVSEKK